MSSIANFFKGLGQTVTTVILNAHFEIVACGRDQCDAELKLMPQADQTNYFEFKPLFDHLVSKGEFHVFTRQLQQVECNRHYTLSEVTRVFHALGMTVDDAEAAALGRYCEVTFYKRNLSTDMGNLYLVSGRVDGDDDDSVRIVEACCIGEAESKLVAHLQEEECLATGKNIKDITIHLIYTSPVSSAIAQRLA